MLTEYSSLLASYTCILYSRGGGGVEKLATNIPTVLQNRNIIMIIKDFQQPKIIACTAGPSISQPFILGPPLIMLIINKTT